MRKVQATRDAAPQGNLDDAASRPVQTEKPQGANATSTRGALWLPVFSALHLVALLILWALENIIGERNRWTALMLYLPQQGLIFAPLLLLFWTARRQWKQRRASTRDGAKTRNSGAAIGIAWFCNGAALALAWFGFLGFVVPLGKRAAPPNALRLRAMTFNVHLGASGTQRIARLIRQENPDIICLQETRALGAIPDPIPPLKKLLPQWHFARSGEVTTLSRFPIVATRVHPIKNTQRVVLETEIVARGRHISIDNTHFITDRAALRRPKNRLSTLGGSAALRLHQMRQLQGIVPENASRVLVMGDFNNPPRGLLYQRLSARWTDAFAAAGFGFGSTFRSDVPLLRIDYIWASRDLRVLAAHVSPQRASDHRAVVADFAIP